ncbi:MAG: class I SAM-dependent methyltransferase [Bacteroidota bacterium]
MNCRLCGSRSLKLFYHQGNAHQFKFYKCTNCGLVNLDLAQLNIADHQTKYTDALKPIKDYNKEIGAITSYRFIQKYVPFRGSYLDIGCGNGALLHFARQDGWQVKGLEILPQYARYVRETLDIDVDVADFMDYDKANEQYDLVSLRHVLEHLPDSVLALEKIKALLKRGGYAHFEFPNIQSISHRFQRFLSRRKLAKKHYKPDYQPGHCNEFSKQSFTYLLQQTGFELVRWETYSHKPLSNFLYNRWHIGTKARAIVRKKGE